jgi:hypothetical protein
LRRGGGFSVALVAAVAVVLLAGPAQPAVPSLISAIHDSTAPTSVAAVAGRNSETLRVVPAPAGTPSKCLWANGGNPYPERRAGYLSFNGNLFSLPVGSVGGSKLCYSAATGKLSDNTRFSALPGAIAHDVLGYPEAIVGENLYGGLEGRSNAMLPLPEEREKNLTNTNTWVTMHYDVKAPGSSPYDFAFDDWLTVAPATGSSTGNEGNRIEVMIWLSNDIGMYLPQTAVHIPTFVGGASTAGTWYRDDLCMGTNDVTFDFLYAPKGVAPGYGLTHATISFNLTSILRSVASVLKSGACWAPAGTTIGSLYASAFPLGAEFYPTVADTSKVEWKVSSLCYVLTPGAPPPGGPSC